MHCTDSVDSRKAEQNDGRAYSHRIPVAELKCVSEKRRKELNLYLGLGCAARRRGEEPGRAPRVKSGRHDRPRSLFRFGA
jgi:hypothetical protein